MRVFAPLLRPPKSRARRALAHVPLELADHLKLPGLTRIAALIAADNILFFRRTLPHALLGLLLHRVISDVRSDRHVHVIEVRTPALLHARLKIGSPRRVIRTVPENGTPGPARLPIDVRHGLRAARDTFLTSHEGLVGGTVALALLLRIDYDVHVWTRYGADILLLFLRQVIVGCMWTALSALQPVCVLLSARTLGDALAPGARLHIVLAARALDAV